MELESNKHLKQNTTDLVTVINGGLTQRIHSHLLINLCRMPLNKRVIEASEVHVRGYKSHVAVWIIPCTERLMNSDKSGRYIR